MDDNIVRFYRLNYNAKIPVADGTIFRAMEAFVERYDNIALAGPNYESFIRRRMEVPPVYLNSRVYSCLLIRNDIPFRWRSRFNDDTDLNLRVLKAGWCTVLFNAFLQNKVATMRMAGGMQYEQAAVKEWDDRWIASDTLRRLHPDVTTVTRKFDRWHHHVDYSRFRANALRLHPGVEVPAGIDNFGMILERQGPNGWELANGLFPWETE
jgi:hypothetical protein